MRTFQAFISTITMPHFPFGTPFAFTNTSTASHYSSNISSPCFKAVIPTPGGHESARKEPSNARRHGPFQTSKVPTIPALSVWLLQQAQPGTEYRRLAELLGQHLTPLYGNIRRRRGEGRRLAELLGQHLTHLEHCPEQQAVRHCHDHQH